MNTNAQTYANYNTTLDVDFGAEVDAATVTCADCGAPHTVHRFVVVEWYAERDNEPAKPRRDLLALQRQDAMEITR